MKTVFALISTYGDAQSAIKNLLEADFDQEEMNIIVQTKIAKDSMEFDLERAKVKTTDEVGSKTMHGLDAMLAGEQPVKVPDIGQVFASGQLATILTKTAAAAEEPDSGLEPALVEFDIPHEAAKEYRTRVEGGDWLFFIRTSDQQASKAIEILKEHHARRVANYTG